MRALYGKRVKAFHQNNVKGYSDDKMPKLQCISIAIYTVDFNFHICEWGCGFHRAT